LSLTIWLDRREQNYPALQDSSENGAVRPDRVGTRKIA
jgi:hypothetical protein